MFRGIFAGGAIVALLGVGFASAQMDRPIRLGEQMPPLDLTYIKGEPIDPARDRGRTITVVEFWATWCKPCEITIPHLTDLYFEHGPRGLKVLGISNESEDVIRPFVDERIREMAYTVAADRDGRTTSRFRQPDGPIPTAFLFNEEGTLIWIGHPAHPELEELIDELLDELNAH